MPWERPPQILVLRDLRAAPGNLGAALFCALGCRRLLRRLRHGRRLRSRQHIPLTQAVAALPFDQIEVDVARVIGARARPQHGREPGAGALPYKLPELLRNGDVGEIDDRAVREFEAAQVEGVGAAVLAEPGARDAVAAPALVRGAREYHMRRAAEGE